MQKGAVLVTVSLVPCNSLAPRLIPDTDSDLLCKVLRKCLLSSALDLEGCVSVSSIGQYYSLSICSGQASF